MRTGENPLSRLVRLAFVGTLAAAALGTFLMLVGSLTVPIAGWGAAYLFAAGLWTLALAALPAVVLALGAVTFRIRHGRWYFGSGSP
jgi:hypothetical protein